MSTEKKIKLTERAGKLLYERLGNCDICPRNCKVNRLDNKKGYCGAGRDLILYTAFLHKGEEPAISGGGGSGTVFFSGCNLKCVYCQNYKFSHSTDGKILDENSLGKTMLKLEEEGASNINLVTPTHFLPQILNSLLIAFREGLGVPIVYNTSGYEKKEIIAQIKGIIDVYLADIKYVTPHLAEKYSSALNYPISCQESCQEMYAQVKEAVWEEGLLKKGLVIRHLVLPGYIQESKDTLAWIKKNIPEALLSIMFQYRPYFKANLYPEINRRIDFSEYKQIKEFSEELELTGWIQDFNPEESLAGPYFESDI